MTARGYRQAEGNRFVRTHHFPSSAGTADGTDALELVIDVLAPSFGSTLRSNQAHGDLVVDEVPGLSLALARAGTTVTAALRLTSGHDVATTLVLPDVVSAICLKAYAFLGRFSDRDALDLWRLLEAANAAGVAEQNWPTGPTPTAAADVLRRHFGAPGAAGLRLATSNRTNQTRIRALVAQVVGLGQRQPGPGATSR